MNLVEGIRVSQKGAQAGFSAEIDGPGAIFDAREIVRISVAEFSSTETDEARIFLLFLKMFRHLKIKPFGAVRPSKSLKDGGLRARKIIELPR
jgi:hypothetical protein